MSTRCNIYRCDMDAIRDCFATGEGVQSKQLELDLIEHLESRWPQIDAAAMFCRMRDEKIYDIKNCGAIYAALVGFTDAELCSDDFRAYDEFQRLGDTAEDWPISDASKRVLKSLLVGTTHSYAPIKRKRDDITVAFVSPQDARQLFRDLESLDDDLRSDFKALEEFILPELSEALDNHEAFAFVVG